MTELPKDSDVIQVLKQVEAPSKIFDNKEATEKLVGWVKDDGTERTISKLIAIQNSKRRNNAGRYLLYLGWAIGKAQEGNLPASV